jgi:hypothetical protein
MLARALFAELRRDGYNRIVLETSQPMARRLDQTLRRGGIEALRQQMKRPATSAVFFGLEEEAQWIASAHAHAKPGEPLFVGIDFELTGLPAIVNDLGKVAKPAAAHAAWVALRDATDAAQRRFLETHNPASIPSFSVPASLAASLMQAWPKPSPDAALALKVIHETLAISRWMQEGKMYASNQRRAALMRMQLLGAMQADPRRARLMLKLGASHLQRGRNPNAAFDLGSLVHEMAQLDGGHAFSVLVVPGKDSQVARFDPSAWTYRPSSSSADAYAQGLSDFVELADRDAFTLYDLRELRPHLAPLEGRGVSAGLASCIHGFDMLLVLSGSTPSQNLV